MYTSLLYSPFPIFYVVVMKSIGESIRIHKNEMLMKQGRKNEILRDIFSGRFGVRTDWGESWGERQETRMEDGDGRWKVDWERVDSS